MINEEFNKFIALLQDYKENKSITSACEACQMMIDFLEEVENL